MKEEFLYFSTVKNTTSLTDFVRQLKKVLKEDQTISLTLWIELGVTAIRAHEPSLTQELIQRSIAEALTDGLKNNRQLRYLSLQDGTISSGRPFHAPIIQAIGDILKHNTALETLDFRLIKFDHLIEHLFDGLTKNTHIKNINFQDGSFANLGDRPLFGNNYDKGMRLLANLIRKSHSLRSITISYDTVTYFGLQYLTDALSQNIGLQSLKFESMNWRYDNPPEQELIFFETTSEKPKESAGVLFANMLAKNYYLIDLGHWTTELKGSSKTIIEKYLQRNKAIHACMSWVEAYDDKGILVSPANYRSAINMLNQFIEQMTSSGNVLSETDYPMECRRILLILEDLSLGYQQGATISLQNPFTHILLKEIALKISRDYSLSVSEGKETMPPINPQIRQDDNTTVSRNTVSSWWSRFFASTDDQASIDNETTSLLHSKNL